MKIRRITWLVATVFFLQAIGAFALSTPIGRDINFPKDYDPEKAKAIRRVVHPGVN